MRGRRRSENREKKNKPAVTKHQQKGIKNFLRFPIKSDYRNKFESLVATPYPILLLLCLSAPASRFPRRRMNTRKFSFYTFVAFCGRGKFTFFYAKTPQTNCRARSINICAVINVSAPRKKKTTGAKYTHLGTQAPHSSIIIERCLILCQMSA